MKSVYNERLCTIPEMAEIQDRFYTTLTTIFDEAKDKDLNLREVSHQLMTMVGIVESEFCMRHSAKIGIAEREESKRRLQALLEERKNGLHQGTD